MSRRLKEKAKRLLFLERGTVFKDPGGKINVCLIYPNTYHVGMSNLGFQGLYTLLNERADVLCERAFLPDEEDMEEYARTGSVLFSLESGRPLGEFDILAFSVSFENDYPNILKILELAKNPLGESGRGPLLIAGGVCAFSNPEPVSEFFDVIFVGEAEEMLDEFIAAYKGASTRRELFKAAMKIEGVYIPALYGVRYDGEGFISERIPLEGAPAIIKRRYVKDISKFSLRPSIITPETEFSGMYLIEAMRGCPWSCRFCLAGHVYGPPRRKELGAITDEIKEAVRKTARVGLIGPSLTDYAHSGDVLKIEGVDFSITSLRASPKSAAIAALMKGHRSVSIAPEAGTERLRGVIDKRVSEEDIIETSRMILKQGIETLRLYFMVGLPTETGEDVEGIVSLVGKIRALSDKGKIVLTVSTFVPKPFTPFQWHPMEKLNVVKERLKYIKKSLSGLKGVRVFHDVPKYAYMQCMFSMGDRRVGAVLRAMLREPDWRQAAKKAGVDPDFYVFREKDKCLGEGRPTALPPLPWDFIDAGFLREKLYSEYCEAVGK